MVHSCVVAGAGFLVVRITGRRRLPFLFGRGSGLLSVWMRNRPICKVERVQLSEACRGLRISPAAGNCSWNPGKRRWLITSEEATSYAPGTQIHAHTSVRGEQPLRPDPLLLLLGAVLILSSGLVG